MSIGTALAVAVPVQTETGTAELVKIEVWRREASGTLLSETEYCVVAASARDGVFPLSAAEFHRVLSETRQERPAK